MTAGSYLRDQRERAGLSREDLALRLDSEPSVSCRSRAELLAAMEADLAPIGCTAAVALHRVLRDAGAPIDLEVLADLADRGRALVPPILRLPGIPAPMLLHSGGEVAA